MDITILSALAGLVLLVVLVESAPASRVSRFLHIGFGPRWDVGRSPRRNYFASAVWFIKGVLLFVPTWILVGYLSFRQPRTDPDTIALVVFFFLMFLSLMSIVGAVYSALRAVLSPSRAPEISAPDCAA
jgi:hypothetical protein